MSGKAIMGVLAFSAVVLGAAYVTDLTNYLPARYQPQALEATFQGHGGGEDIISTAMDGAPVFLNVTPGDGTSDADGDITCFKGGTMPTKFIVVAQGASGEDAETMQFSVDQIEAIKTVAGLDPRRPAILLYNRDRLECFSASLMPYYVHIGFEREFHIPLGKLHIRRIEYVNEATINNLFGSATIRSYHLSFSIDRPAQIGTGQGQIPPMFSTTCITVKNPVENQWVFGNCTA